MSYRYFIIEPDDYEKYPEIPEYYYDEDDNVSIIMGADDGGEGGLSGLLIGSASLTDESIVHVSYIWCRKQSISGEVFGDMLPVFLSELKKAKFGTVCFRLLNTNAGVPAFLTAKMLEDAGFIRAEEHGLSGGYLLYDFYDTLFMRTSVIKSFENEHLVSFTSCTKEECRNYLEELVEGSENADLSFVSRMPFSYFFMEKNSPIGALTIEQYSQNGCIIDGVFIKQVMNRGKVFRALLAGVLSGALDGMGMQTRLYIRFYNSEYLRVLEECLGEWSFDLEISDYKYSL